MLKRKCNYKLDVKEDVKLDIKLDHLTESDLPEIAKLYEAAFSNHFLGHMGQKFLMLFCSQFMNSCTNYGYVAKFNGKPVGFLLGSIDDTPFHQFYRQNFIVLALIVIKRYLLDSYVRRNITKRLGYILAATKTLTSFPKREGNDRYNTFVPARLLAIGVDQNYRGLGIANQLTSQFCADMKSKGFKKVGLSVLNWNERAINFYHKDGWVLEDSCERSSSFSRNI